MSKTHNQKFIANLDRKIEFHRNNQNDPHNIGNAVLCALIEVREAFAEAHDCGLAETQGDGGDGDPPPEPDPK